MESTARLRAACAGLRENDPAFTTLDLGLGEIGDEGVAALSEALRVNTTITRIMLQSNRIGDAGASSLSEALKDNTTITSINLGHNQIGVSGASSLSEALKVNTTITTIQLWSNQIGDAGASSLSEALKVNKTITYIPLGNNRIGAWGAFSLSEALKVNTTVTSIDLESNQIGASGASSLSEALKVNRTITGINLRYNEIGASGASSLSEALKDNRTITWINLKSNQIGASGAFSLSEALKVNTTVTTIDLEGNRIGATGASSLSEALKVNGTITTIDLENNHIGDAGAASLSEALKVNRTITTINLVGNQIGAWGASSLSEALKVNKAIIWIDLGSNQIGDAGVSSLSEALKVNKTITDIHLRNNRIGASGASSLSEALKVNKAITLINLESNRIGDAGAASLSEAFKVNRTITGISLENNQIGDVGASSLSEALKVNTTLTYIYLRYNEIGASGASSLSEEALKANKTIIGLQEDAIHEATDNYNLESASVDSTASSSSAPSPKLLSNNNTPTPLFPSQAAHESLEEALNRYLGIGELRFQELLGQYQKQGRDHFARQFLEQDAALSALVEKRQEAFTAELVNREGRHARELLQRAFEEYQARATHLTLGQVQEVRQAIDQLAVPDLEQQLVRITSSAEYDRQLLKLQVLFSDELNQRQQQLINEAIHAQEERREIRDQQNPLIRQYAAKQKRIREQLALQSPQAVCVFYNTIEQIFGARISSAVMLVNGCLKRSDTQADKVIGLGADITGGFCEAIPVVGGVVGSLVTFGIQELGGAVVDRRQGKKYQNTQEGVIRLKDAMALSELCARRVAESYVSHITQERLTLDKAKKAGERAAKAMYRYLAQGKLRDHAQRSLEEKMDELVKAVHEVGRKEKGIVRKKGGVFNKVTEPEQPPQSSRAQGREVVMLGQGMQALKEQSELSTVQLRNETVQLRNQIERMERQARQSAPTVARISTLAEEADRQEAARQLQAKGLKAITENVPLQVSRAQKIVTLTYRGINAEERASLRDLGRHLGALLHSALLHDLNVDQGCLQLVLRSSLDAEDMDELLRAVGLNIV